MIIKSKPTLEGAGEHLNRVFGNNDGPLFDPFLRLDDFRSGNPAHYLAGFPWHQHRSIETITYVLRGDVAHGDSMGNKGVIFAGDTQWMTAGNDIILMCIGEIVKCLVQDVLIKKSTRMGKDL